MVTSEACGWGMYFLSFIYLFKKCLLKSCLATQQVIVLNYLIFFFCMYACMHYFRAGGKYFLLFIFWKVTDADGTKFKTKWVRNEEPFSSSGHKFTAPRTSTAASFSHIVPEILRIHRSTCGWQGHSFSRLGQISPFLYVSMWGPESSDAKHQAPGFCGFIHNNRLHDCPISQTQPHTVIMVNASIKGPFCPPNSCWGRAVAQQQRRGRKVSFSNSSRPFLLHNSSQDPEASLCCQLPLTYLRDLCTSQDHK